jgi:hypothetical protein
MPGPLYRLVDLRPRSSRRAAPTKLFRVLFLASAVLFLTATLLSLFGVPFPVDERVRPNVVILARARGPEHKAFIDALHDRLLRSGLVGSVRFADSVAGEPGAYQPAGAAQVHLPRVGGADALCDALADLGRNERSPLVAVTINCDESPNSLWWSEEERGRLGRLHSAGVLCLDLADPPEAQPDMQIADITRGPEQSMHIHLITVNARSAPGGSRTLRLKLRGSHAALTATLTGSKGQSQPLRVTLEGDAASILIPFQHTSSDHPDWCDLSILGLDPADIRELSIVKEDERGPASTAPPHSTSRQQKGPRALMVPLAAFLEDLGASDPAWRRQLRGYLDGDSLLRLVADGLRQRVVLGRTVTAPPYECDVLSPERPGEANSAAESVVGPLAQAFVDADTVWRQSDAYPLIILDLSWPLGLPAERRDEFVKAFRSPRFGKFLTNLKSLLRTRPVHVLVLGYTSLLLDRTLPEHPLDPLVREVDEQFSGKERLSKGAAGTDLFLLFDRTESAGNSADVETARLRTLPPLSLDAYRRLTDLLHPQTNTGGGPGAAPTSPPENKALARCYLRRLLGAELLGDRPLDESAIARFSREGDSKASVLAAVASEVADWGSHPLLNTQVQGVNYYRDLFRAGNQATPTRPELNPLLNFTGTPDVTLEAVELEDMLDYLRRSTDRQAGGSDLGGADRTAALLLYDADDRGTPASREVRRGGRALTEPYTPAPYQPRGSVEGFLLGLRSLDDPQGPFEVASLRAILENRGSKSLTNSTAFGRAFLYGGRSRLAEYASAFLAESLRGRRAIADYPQLRALTSRLGLACRNKAVSDEFCALVSANLRLVTRPSVTVGAATPLVPLASVRNGSDETWPLFLVGRVRGGGVLTLCTVDYALEQEVFRHTFVASAARFEDWVFSTGQVDSDSGTHLLHVQSLGATEDGLLFRFELYSVDDRSIPGVPKAREQSFAKSEVGVSAEVISRYGAPGLLLPLALKNGILMIPQRAGGRPVAPGGEAIVRLKLKPPQLTETFEVFVPVAFRSPDTQFSLQTGPELSSTLVVYAEMIRDALAPATTLDGRGSSQAPEKTTVRENSLLAAALDSRAPAANGIGLGIEQGKPWEHRVIPCRLELPLRHEALSTDHGEMTRAEAAVKWIENRISEVFIVSTSRNWLIVASLFAGLTIVIRTKTQGWWPSRNEE